MFTAFCLHCTSSSLCGTFCSQNSGKITWLPALVFIFTRFMDPACSSVATAIKKNEIYVILYGFSFTLIEKPFFSLLPWYVTALCLTSVPQTLILTLFLFTSWSRSHLFRHLCASWLCPSVSYYFLMSLAIYTLMHFQSESIWVLIVPWLFNPELLISCFLLLFLSLYTSCSGPSLVILPFFTVIDRLSVCTLTPAMDCHHSGFGLFFFLNERCFVFKCFPRETSGNLSGPLDRR